MVAVEFFVSTDSSLHLLDDNLPLGQNSKPKPRRLQVLRPSIATSGNNLEVPPRRKRSSSGSFISRLSIDDKLKGVVTLARRASLGKKGKKNSSEERDGEARKDSGEEGRIVYSANKEDYKNIRLIGTGGSAKVYYATFQGFPIALKTVDFEQIPQCLIDESRRETQIMNLCRHANLLSVHTAFVADTTLHIVTPLIHYGSCREILRTLFPYGLPEFAITQLLAQLLSALVYLHASGFVHRDVKPGNMLLDKAGNLKLADFGLSISSMEDADKVNGGGTPVYMAPEVITRQGCDARADIWSFGITALEFAYGRPPYHRVPKREILRLILKCDPPRLDPLECARPYSPALRDIISFCLRKDPSRRPTALQLLRHPYFASIQMGKRNVSLVEALRLDRMPPVWERTNPIRKPASCPAAQQLFWSPSQVWDFAISNHLNADIPLPIQCAEGIQSDDRAIVKVDTELVNTNIVLTEKLAATPQPSGPMAVPTGEEGDSTVTIQRYKSITQSIPVALTTDLSLIDDGDMDVKTPNLLYIDLSPAPIPNRISPFPPKRLTIIESSARNTPYPWAEMSNGMVKDASPQLPEQPEVEPIKE
ncbi:uncharacterized protein VTP21DRAFT_1172 [Calcarisporiella thermophila]|uniref:uncharacterized protein n=1 Tax=Calcarisporiella thermophila TaxID=911321 RepID=UPI003742CEE8